MLLPEAVLYYAASNWLLLPVWCKFEFDYYSLRLFLNIMKGVGLPALGEETKLDSLCGRGPWLPGLSEPLIK
jgi:hypothetical protein